METWNVVITVHEGCYNLVREYLKQLGDVRKTVFFNVLVMAVDDIQQVLETLKAMIDEEPEARRVPDAVVLPGGAGPGLVRRGVGLLGGRGRHLHREDRGLVVGHSAHGDLHPRPGGASRARLDGGGCQGRLNPLRPRAVD